MVPPQREVLVSYMLEKNNNTLIMTTCAPFAQTVFASAEFTLLKFYKVASMVVDC